MQCPIGKQFVGPLHQFRSRSDPDGGMGGDGILCNRLEIECMRSDQNRFSDSTGFDQILPPEFFKTASDKGDVACGIVHEHFSHGVA